MKSKIYSLFMIVVFLLPGQVGSQDIIKRIKNALPRTISLGQELPGGTKDTVALILNEADSAKVVSLAVPVIIQGLRMIYDSHNGKVREAANESEGELKLEMLGLLSNLSDPRSLGILVASLPTGWMVVEGIINIGIPSIDTLSYLIEKGDNLVRAKSAYALGRIGKTKIIPEIDRNSDLKQKMESRILPALRKAAQDNNQLVRSKADEALILLNSR